MTPRERAETVVANWKEDKSHRPVHLVDYVEAAIVIAEQAAREEERERLSRHVSAMCVALNEAYSQCEQTGSIEHERRLDDIDAALCDLADAIRGAK